MSTENFENASVAPDGQPAEEQPVWRQEYPIDWPAAEYVTRREFTRLLLVTSFAFVVGQAWIVLSQFGQEGRRGSAAAPGNRHNRSSPAKRFAAVLLSE